MSWLLPVLFFATALLYAAVGFGGGSTYNALLVLYGVDYRILPTIALACNIIVVTGGVWRFSRSGSLSLKRMLPFILTSTPAAWIGGRIPVSEALFIGLLGAALLLSGLRLLLIPQPSNKSPTEQGTNWPVSLSVGAAIGILSGMVGIGGGIFLAPILYLMKWGTARQIAAACSLFILVNSLSGLAGQLTKLSDLAILETALPYWPLIVSVFVGGQIGSWIGSDRLNANWMKRLTAALILYVAARLLLRWIALI
jgi:uncharacterized membrane protein YfcA